MSCLDPEDGAARPSTPSGGPTKAELAASLRLALGDVPSTGLRKTSSPARQERARSGGSRSKATQRPSSAPSASAARASRRLDLIPSAAPTPRVPNVTRIGSAVISAPSYGSQNDAARAKNLGTRLALNFSNETGNSSMPVSQIKIEQSASEPMLGAQTPRRARGLVRRISKVAIQYPPSPARSSRRPTPTSPASPQVKRTRPSSAPSSVARSNSLTKVSFADEKMEEPAKLTTSQSTERGGATPALRRSIAVLDTLYVLRRINKTAFNASPDAQSPETVQLPEDDCQESFMHSVLRDLTDTPASLREIETSLSKQQEAVLGCGGSRHATAVVSFRLHDVATRKAHLLEEVESRLDAFQKVHDRREELLASALQNPDVFEAPSEFRGIRKFIAAYTHSPGEPADANKSDFNGFVGSMRLPAKHRSLVTLRRLADEAGEWWASACLSEAEKGMGHKVLHRLFEVAVATGVDREHPKIVRAQMILADRLADRVLMEARERKEFDARRAQLSASPMPGPAADLADMIELDITNALKNGVFERDPRIQEAMQITKELRADDSLRKRMQARQKRLAQKT